MTKSIDIVIGHLTSASAVVLVSVASMLSTTNAADPTTDASFYPDSIDIYAEVPDGTSLIAFIFDHPLRQKIEALPPFQVAVASPQYQQFLMGRTMIESQVQMKWREALEAFLDHRTSIGLDVQSGGFAMVIHGADADAMKRFFDTSLTLAQMSSGNAEIWKGDYRGVPAFRLNDLRFALRDDRIVLANQSDLGKAVIDRLIDGGASLEQNERFQDAMSSRKQDPLVWLFADLESIRTLPAVRAGLESKIDQPLAEATVGGLQSVFAEAPYAALQIEANELRIRWSLQTPFDHAWIPVHREYYFGPEATGQGLAIPQVDQTLLTLSTYRDLSQFWLHAGDLFGQQTNDALAQADASLTTLFAGSDFGEDILGALRPELGFVATRQSFEKQLPRPAIKLPAFAIVGTLREPETMRSELRRTFQSLIGFFNVVGAMNGQSQMDLGMQQGDAATELVTATFVPEPQERDSTHARILYNFSPSIGFAGDRFVIASTAELAQKLTEAPTPDPRWSPANTEIDFDVHVLHDILVDNEEQLIAQNMLSDGHTRQEAEMTIELLLQVVRYFDSARLQLHQANGRLNAEVEIRVQP